ncbi:MAG: Smr/MutS family protein, partial [Saprospiraceae bacterium]|nr:Smr/MutS family protein [Saprospiraceae bacterium]
DDEGEVLDSASEELLRIRREIRYKFQSIDRAFNQEMGRFKQLGYLAESGETIRNGRRVLAVLPENKRKVRGIIHDTSATGRTFFIEPEQVMLLNNDLFDLRNDEKAEINRILKALAAQLRLHLEQLETNEHVIINLDVVQAKALQAKALDASMPQVVEERSSHLVQGQHPLLVLKNQSDRSAVIPFDLAIDKESTIVIISGPNAGGKTVTLKAFGLLQMMVQSSLLIPASKESRVGIFSKICGDIGDQQSIEEDLSTYSSHLKNLRQFLSVADENTLVLLDEFGSGTDPSIGGALSEAILLSLHKKQVRGLVTTHYGNLKLLASHIKGIKNAGMEFDAQHLRPTFSLIADTPGSSYAFEMARRSGLSRKIIAKAKALLGKRGSMEDLITSLRKEKKTVDKQKQALLAKEKQLDKLIGTYEQLRAELDVRRKKLKVREKTEIIATKNEANKELQRLIQDIREKEKIDAAKALSKKIKAEQKALSSDIEEIQEGIFAEQSENKTAKPFEEGDHVRFKMGGIAGTIIKIKKAKATIQSGNLTVDAKLSDLVHGQEAIDLNPTRSVRTSIDPNKETYRKLDLRGLSKEEASPRLERFIDQAVISNLPSVEIIHGKGSGVLRRIVREILEAYPQEIEIWHPEANQGGDGVTLAKL